MKKIALRSALLTFVVSFLIAMPVSAEYELGVVQSTGKTGSFISTIIDSDGDIHLCYWRANKIYYLRQVNGVWQSEVFLTGSVASADHYPHFSLDTSQNAHFVYTPSNAGPIKYQKFTASSGAISAPIDVITGNEAGDDTNRCDISLCPNGDIFVVAQSDWGIEWDWKPNGQAWKNPTSQLYRNTNSEPVCPQVTCGSSNLPVTIYSTYWSGGNNEHIGVSQKANTTDNTWNGPMSPGRLLGLPFLSDMTTDSSGNVHVTWLEWDLESSEQFNVIGYMKRTGQTYPGTWSSKLEIYNQSLLVTDTPTSPPTPSPKIAVTPEGDICVAFARMMFTSIWDTRFLLKENGKAWPQHDYFNPPPQIVGNSTKQTYPGIAADPRTGKRQFVVAWEDEPTTSPGAVKYRTISVIQQGVPSMTWPALIVLCLSITAILVIRK